MKISALNSEEPFSGQTIAVETIDDNEKVEEVVRISRERYATKYSKPVPVIRPKTKKPVESIENSSAKLKLIP